MMTTDFCGLGGWRVGGVSLQGCVRSQTAGGSILRWREHLPPNEFPLGLLFIYSISPRLIENPSEAVISQCSLRLER